MVATFLFGGAVVHWLTPCSSDILIRGMVLLERTERVAGRQKHVTLGSTYSKLSNCGTTRIFKVVLMERCWMIVGYDRICFKIFIPVSIKPKVVIFVETKRRGPSWCRW